MQIVHDSCCCKKLPSVNNRIFCIESETLEIIIIETLDIRSTETRDIRITETLDIIMIIYLFSLMQRTGYLFGSIVITLYFCIKQIILNSLRSRTNHAFMHTCTFNPLLLLLGYVF